ncbi:XVIPCD domain-containing protein [Lysobacter yangpyeongensis]|uniref:XVIPCD domain-containing protein n=1 Tax=Lysobacter yangpyeongensis TaxID=346182 RepID=A0ABW0SQH3_9GAMM
MTGLVYDSMIQPRGREYRDSQVSRRISHYDDPIDRSPGRLAGNSHVWGDASPEVQSRAIDALIAASERAGLSNRETAHVLAIARVESGFNPDAAAGTTSAYGLGQFVKGTGAAYGISNENRGDIAKQAESLVAHYRDNAALAKSRGQGEEYIYKYHHDGPSRDYGGLGISQREVTPYIARYERFVSEHRHQNFGLLSEIKEIGDRLEHGTPTFKVSPVDGMPDYLRHANVHERDAMADGRLGPGDTGPLVARLQKQLGGLGYRDSHGHGLVASGTFDGRTKAAVESFQLWNGLPTTGNADLKTLEAIYHPKVQPFALPGEAADLNVRTDGGDRIAAHGSSPAEHHHPDHALLERIRDGVRELDHQAGKPWDERSERLSASLLVLAGEKGFTAQEDVRVAFNQPTSNLKAGELVHVFRTASHSPDPAANQAHMSTAQALATPAEESYRQLDAVRQSQTEAPQVAQQQDLQRDPTNPHMSMKLA